MGVLYKCLSADFSNPTYMSFDQKPSYSCITVSMAMVLEFVFLNLIEFHVVDLGNSLSFFLG